MYKKRELECDCIISTGGDPKAAPTRRNSLLDRWIYAEPRSRNLHIKLDLINTK